MIGSGNDDGDAVNSNNMCNTYLKVCYGVFAGKVFELRSEWGFCLSGALGGVFDPLLKTAVSDFNT